MRKSRLEGAQDHQSQEKKVFDVREWPTESTAMKARNGRFGQGEPEGLEAMGRAEALVVDVFVWLGTSLSSKSRRWLTIHRCRNRLQNLAAKDKEKIKCSSERGT